VSWRDCVECGERVLEGRDWITGSPFWWSHCADCLGRIREESRL
jgi:hypothetical protein